jgi:spermidine synthase
VPSPRTQTLLSPQSSPLVTSATRARLFFWAASTLFFLSGGTGLAYQVVWFKRFSHALGNSSFAMSAVVASFLTGLGLGAHLIGRVSDRVRWPLFWYGVAEAAIGVIALLIPFEISGLFEVSTLLYPVLEGKPALQAIVWFILTFIILAPPTILMGGTLPLLIKQFTPPDGAPRESTGWLYAINTLGAATGCYLAGFHLLPSLGLRWTNVTVAALNLTIGAVAMSLQWTAMRREATRASPAPVPSRLPLDGAYDARRGPSLGVLYLTVALTGAAALILEMVWTRQLALVLGGSTYAFTAMLFLLLVGIGLGSMAFHVWFRKSSNASLVAALVIVGLGASTVLGKLLLPELSAGVGLLKLLRRTETGNAAICVLASAVLELLPAIAMGLLFPLFVDLTRKRAAEAGRAIGNIYAWNTVGSILGATLTSLALIPWLGTSDTIALALGMYTAALVLLFPFPKKPADLWALFGLFALMGGFTFVAAHVEPDPRSTNLGYFMYGYDGQQHQHYKTEYFKEGSSCNVYVARQHGHYSLRVNGKVDASTSGDMNTQLGSAYFPLFIHPDAREVLVIGFGSGTTSGAALQFPHTHVTCCEIEPAVYNASIWFKSVNHSPQDSPRFKVVFDDGRSHLQGTRKKFDHIISEPSNPWIAGCSNLFTREFYLAVRDKLTEKGILTQWIQLYSFSAADYALVVRTVMQVFPHCGLLRISDGDTLLLASMSPFASSKESIDRAQGLVDTLPRVQQDLDKYFGTTDVRALLLNHILLDEQGLGRLLDMERSNAINTDLNLTLEFDAPIRLFAPGDSRADMKARILSSANTAWFTKLAEQWGFTKKQAPAFHNLSGLFDRIKHAETVLGLLEIGLSLDPDNIALLTDKLILSRALDDETFARLAKKVTEASNKEANRLGVTLFKDGQTQKSEALMQRAATVFEGLVTLYPESVSSWNNLAVAYDGLSKIEETEKAFQRALSLDPLSETTRSSYQNFTTKRTRKSLGLPGPSAETAETGADAPAQPATADQGPAVGPFLPPSTTTGPAESAPGSEAPAGTDPAASPVNSSAPAPESAGPPVPGDRPPVPGHPDKAPGGPR